MEHSFDRWDHPTDRDLDGFVSLMSQAFGTAPSQSARWLNRAGTERARIVLAENQVAAGLAFYDMGWFFGGRSVPTWGIAGVAVAPEHRRRGLASAMMQRVLREGAERGIALSGLYAANHALYRSVGYGECGSRFVASIAPDRIGVVEREGTIRPMGDEDRDVQRQLYRGVARKRNGFLDRDEALWRRATHDRDDEPYRSWLAVDPSGAPQGYLTVHPAGGKGISQVLEVIDMVACTPWALRRLLCLLADHATMVGEVRWPSSPADPTMLTLPAPRVNMTLWENFYLRVLDIEAAMKQRGWPEGVTGRVDLLLEDPVVSANQGTWRLDVSGGEARITRGGNGSVRLGARALASLYTGFHSPWTTRTAGLLEGPDRDLTVLEALFAGPAPWMPETF